MNKLHIFYDATCGLCQRIREWMGRQPAFVTVEFLPLQSSAARARFPGIETLKPGERMVVVNEHGEAWQGVDAWVMCLWALREYRAWSLRLTHPLLKPFARRVCEMVSGNRHAISRWVFREPPELAAEWLGAGREDCADDKCGIR